MKDRYRIGEVEKLLGIPRTTIRYYIKKGILHVDKDKSNGYRYYSQRDVFEIMHILIGRNVLNMSVENSNERIHAKSLKDFHAIFDRQKDFLDTQIANAQRSLEVLNIYKEMLDRAEKNIGIFQIRAAGPFHILSSEYLLNATTSAFDIGFHTAIFEEVKGLPVYRDICSFVHDRQKELLSPEIFASRLRTVTNKNYVYTVIECDGGMEDPKILVPALTWAKKQRLILDPPYYLSYLFQVEKEEHPHYYYEVYLPIKDSNTSS